MDVSYLIRAIVAILLAGLLAYQSRTLHDRPHRKRAFRLAAVALLTLGLSNSMMALGITAEILQSIVVIIGVALFLGAVVSMLLSFRAGEMGDQRQQIANAAREYREQREEQMRKKP